MAEITDDYIRGLYADEDMLQSDVDRARTAMQKYGENHWWESNDPVHVARYQAFENIFLAVNRKAYHRGLSMILDRPVIDAEFLFNLDELRKEVEIGLRRYDMGIGVSDEYRETAMRRGIKLIENICSEAEIPLVKFDLNSDNNVD